MISYEFILLLFLFFASIVLVFLYKKIAIRLSILASPNYRSLHNFPIPKGGGFVFAIIFIVTISIFNLVGELSENFFFIFVYGAGVATFFGIIDDINNIKAKKKIIIHIMLSFWIIYCIDLWNFLKFDLIINICIISFVSFLLVWLINAYNFIDGIDGMAASGAIFISLTLASILLLNDGPYQIVCILLVLAVSIGGFIIFNWPPASLFMGDAGSIFLGYIFGALLLLTVINGDLSIWTWLIVFGYFFADTFVTQIIRVIYVNKWWHAHRSHAYQNLARITGSHLKVTLGVLIYNIFWILPLTFWSVIKPETAIFATILAISPGIIFSFKFGPMLSSS